MCWLEFPTWKSTLSVCFIVFSLKAILILNILRVSFNVKTLRICSASLWHFSQLLSLHSAVNCVTCAYGRDELFDSMHSATVIFHLQRMMQNIYHNAIANICKRSRKNGELLFAFSLVKLCSTASRSSSGGSTFYLLLESKTIKEELKETNIFHEEYGTVCWCKR